MSEPDEPPIEYELLRDATLAQIGVTENQINPTSGDDKHVRIEGLGLDEDEAGEPVNDAEPKRSGSSTRSRAFLRLVVPPSHACCPCASRRAHPPRRPRGGQHTSATVFTTIPMTVHSSAFDFSMAHAASCTPTPSSASSWGSLFHNGAEATAIADRLVHKACS